jgi:NAD(P)-dependent dehydrogenase (short-subunit alcohol dehydrogenase family)
MALQKQRVVILGGTAGIGLATARAALAQDAEVIITARKEDELAEVTHQLGKGLQTACLDAMQADQLVSFFAGIHQLDHLVLSLSAGPAGVGSIRTLSLVELRNGFEGKFWPFIGALQASLPHLRAHGSITFVSAASAGAPLIGTAGFAAINGAINAMVPGLAVELRPLRVNAVAPGLVDTRFWSVLPEKERAAMLAQYAKATPVGRNASADDVAHAIVSLMSNGFVTGVVLPVDGGLSLSPPKAA